MSSRVYYTSNMITVSGYTNCALFPSNFNNGYVTEILYVKGRVFIFLVYLSDILPTPPSLTRTANLIVNTDSHTAK